MLFNRARAAAYMDRYGLDALVATSPVNITYFADYFCWLDPLFKEYMSNPGASSDLAQAYAVVPREGEPALVIGPLLAINAAESWIRDIHWFGDPGLDTSLPPGPLPDSWQRFASLFEASRRNATPTDALLSVLDARGLSSATIGVDMEGLTAPAKTALLDGLPGASIKNCSNLIRLIRIVKSPDEIARLRRAAEINEIASMESLALAKAGRPITDLIQAYRKRIGELGADFDHYAYCVRGLGIATEPNYVLAQDDVMYVDFGCLYQHYFSDSGTTLALRPLPAVMLERFNLLRDCVKAGADTIRPGVKASVVRGAMWQTLAAQGITSSNPHGHSLGLEVRDYPIVVADNKRRIRDDCVDVPSDIPLETDMVINLEAPIFSLGVGSLHVEQTFIVTETGCKPLVPQDRTTPVITAATR